MHETIISSVKTGRVQRKFFTTREQADRYVDAFFAETPFREARPRRAYRVEVIYHRTALRPGTLGGGLSVAA
jgi:hypothetical protein